MEESLQVVPSSVAAEDGDAASGISCQPTTVYGGLFDGANTAPMAAAAQRGLTAAVPKAANAAEATVARCQPKAKRKLAGTPPPAKRSKVAKVKVDSDVAGSQPVATVTKPARLTRQKFQEQAKTFTGKEDEYFRAAQKYDHLTKLPSAGHEYVSTTRTGAPRLLRTCNDPPYTIYVNAVVEHPKIKEAQKRGVFTKTMAQYYLHMKPGVNIPVAGIPLDKRQEIQASEELKGSLKKPQAAKEGPASAVVASASEKRSTRSAATKPAFSNGSVPLALVLEALDGQQTFIEEATKAMNPTAQTPRTLSDVHEQALNYTPDLTFGPISSLLDILERRAKHDLSEQEEAFYARPSIKIIIPDMLKGLLVDDWENVTKNNQLVPIPHPKPVAKVMDDYLAYEKPRRTEGSAAIDILEETVSGLKEYFDKCLGRILLYRFERAQYAEIREKWTSGGSDVQGKTPLRYLWCRAPDAFDYLPELIAQTNMDQQSVNRLREELSKFCQWLERNAGTYFVSEYESPNAEYAEKAKN
ncbi:uncharacterized protein PG986_009596 [Apiospora aurea]|uniref:MRG domain-containing protein n=1 Tax=Apiospora aurea TaxID=335848 RepID=A0ABR1Q862_9PEZI